MISSTRTVVVLGASYAGHRAVHLLVRSLPDDWRVVVIERNTHFNHLYTFPRLAVLPGHERKAFIPYTKLFKPESCPGNATATTAPEPAGSHQFIHANVTELESHRVYFERLGPAPGFEEESFVDFDYLVYALGSHLPAPINIWSSTRCAGFAKSKSEEKFPTRCADCDCGSEFPGVLDEEHAGTKAESSRWLREAQKRIKASTSVLIVGGGALGVQFATDIADVYPEKPVTLIHSRGQLLPRFDKWMHESVMERLDQLKVRVMLHTRIDLSSIKSLVTSPYITPSISTFPSRAASPAFSTPGLSASSSANPSPTPSLSSPKIPTIHLPPPLEQIEDCQTVLTTDGKRLQADLVLFCTGQVQNTWFLESISPQSINHRDGGAAYVLPSLQLAIKRHEKVEPSEHPHIFVIGDAADAFGALKAGHVAWEQAEFACRNILKLIRGGEEELDQYSPPQVAIKVSLGLKHTISQAKNGKFTHQEVEDPTLGLSSMWQRRGISTVDMTI